LTTEQLLLLEREHCCRNGSYGFELQNSKNTRAHDIMMMMTDEIKFLAGIFKDIRCYMQKCCQ
jgi:hypothetical protein